jgi:pimeloyl-ACP methyl ester carboxylesterase
VSFLDLAGRRFHYLDRGDPGAPAVLLLHGFNQTCHSWDELAPRLVDGGHRVVARLAGALVIERFAVIGMSMGAVHATLAAVRHPARVRALVLVDWAPEVKARGVGAIARMAALSFPSFDAAVDAAALAAHPRFREPPEVMWRALEEVACPALVVRGAESDLLGAEAAERVARTLRDAELCTVPGAGHSVPGDNPDGFHAAVAPFLARVR